MAGPFWAKYTTFDLKRYRGVYFMTLKSHAKFEEKLTCGLKMTWGIWKFFIRTPENVGCFWPNYIMFGLKSTEELCLTAFKIDTKFEWKLACVSKNFQKHRGVMFDGTEYWCKIWRKNDLCFQKWREEFCKFSPEHVRKSKNGTLMGLFYPK